MAKFVNVFPPVVLALSVVGAIILTGPLVVFVLVAQDGVRALTVPDQSSLSRAIVDHPVGFASFWWLFCVVAIAASVGLLRRKRWAVHGWLALLGILILWSLTVILSELINVATSDLGASPGLLPSNAVMAAAAAIPVGVVIGAAAAFLFVKLLAHRHEFEGSRIRS